jgi:hypothetical protein
MLNRLSFWLSMLSCLTALADYDQASSRQKNSIETISPFSDSMLTKIGQGFEQRRSRAFETLRSKPLVRKAVLPPVFSDGSNFSRAFSYALIDFAFKCFWLNERIGPANDALMENSDYYIGYPAAYKDRDSFYWAADELCRIVEFFGSKGTIKAGLVTEKVEERILLMMWQYSKTQSKVAKAEYRISKTWYVDESENHHAQRFSCAWHFAKFLKDHPLYKDLKYDDGFTAAEHYAAWTVYIKQWIVERSRKGLFVEMANDGYGLETLKGIYNCYDFGADQQLRELSGKLLDTYWAAWAQEQLSGVSGGGKSRIYPSRSFSGRTELWKMAWYYLGINELNEPEGNLYTLVTSDYRMPLVVMDIALDAVGRGVYEITQRRQGLAEKGFFAPPDYHLREEGGLLRYSYCSPEFIAGTLFCEARPYEDWTLISSQNRWVGVIFNGDPDSRIYPLCKTGDNNRAFNQLWCVQKQGSMIVQKLKDNLHSRGAGQMQIWISNAGLFDRVEKEGWVFVASKGCYTAIRCTEGGYSWREAAKGKWLVCDNSYTPIIIEVALKSDFVDYRQFQQTIFAHGFSVKSEILSYRSLNRHILTLPINYKGMPAIDGKNIDLAPAMAMDSPFVRSRFDSGIVEIQKGGRKVLLNFNSGM